MNIFFAIASNHNRIRPILLLWIICLLLSSTPARAAPALQGGDSSYTVGACRNIDRENLRVEIEQVALDVLASGGSRLDIDALTARKWAELGVDAVIDAEVARAVADLAAQEGYLDRLWSGWSAEKAEEYASRIAEDAFRSPAFTAKIEEVGKSIGAEIARSIDAEFARAASVAFLCLKDYVGDAYADVLFEAFQTGVKVQVQHTQMTIDPAELDVSAITNHTAGLAGLSVLVITEVGRRVSQKIGEKIAGRIAGKIIGRVLGRAGSSFLPVIGWAVGIGLIAWDLYEGGKGSLPQIEEALTSEEVKERIRGEIVDAVVGGLPEETGIASLEIAVTLLEAWDAFCSEHAELCRQAAASPGFRSLLDNTALSDLERLNKLVDVFVDEIGRSELNRAIEVGALDTLLAQPAATTLLTTTRSITDTLAWVKLAGDQLDRVVALGVAQQAQPDEIDPAGLSALLTLEDAEAAKRVLAFAPDETATLLALPGELLKRLVETFSVDELRWLVTYLARLEDAGGATSPAQVVDDLVNGRVSLAQLQATPVPTPTQTPMQTPTPPIPTPEENIGDPPSSAPPTSPVLFLLALIAIFTVGLVLLQRRNKRTARRVDDKAETEQHETKA
jgi:hypothetical protein